MMTRGVYQKRPPFVCQISTLTSLKQALQDLGLSPGQFLYNASVPFQVYRSQTRDVSKRRPIMDGLSAIRVKPQSADAGCGSFTAST